MKWTLALRFFDFFVLLPSSLTIYWSSSGKSPLKILSMWDSDESLDVEYLDSRQTSITLLENLS